MANKKHFDLGDELENRLNDFCEAHYGASQVKVVRAALNAFIESELEKEPELRKRYELAREQRLGHDSSNIRAINNKGDIKP